MVYVVAQYWPFIVIAFVIGIAVGWLFRDPARRQSATQAEDFEK